MADYFQIIQQAIYKKIIINTLRMQSLYLGNSNYGLGIFLRFFNLCIKNEHNNYPAYFPFLLKLYL